MLRTLLLRSLLSLTVAGCWKPSETPDAGDEPELGGADGDDDAGPGPRAVQHEACTAALPDTLPAQPDFSDSLAGTPRYSSWAELACDAWPGRLSACSDTRRCAGDEVCLKVSDPQAEGVCMPFLFASDGAVPVPSTYRAGQCAGSVDPAFKAAACCNGTVGFDCRVFPLAPEAARSAPGELCTAHEDCEPGLVCGRTADTSQASARCVCPDVDASLLVEPADCVSYGEERDWGGPALVFTGSCAPALTEGWVVEVISADPGEQLRAALTPDGALHLLASAYDAGPESQVVHLTLREGVWSRQVIEGVNWGAYALESDRQGTLHAALGNPLHYGSLASGGTWQLEPLARDVVSADLALDADGVPSLAYAGSDSDTFEDVGTVIAVREDSGFRELSLGESEFAFEVALGFDAQGSPRLVYTVFDNETAGFVVRSATRSGETFERLDLDAGLRVAGARGADGTLWVSYAGDPYYDVERNVWNPAAALRLLQLGTGSNVQTVWNHRDPDIRPGTVDSSIALDRDGRPWLAHTAPQGIVLRGAPDHYQTVPLAPDSDAVPELLFDAAGEAHVFYAIVERNDGVDGDGAVRFAQLRHVHRGSCP